MTAGSGVGSGRHPRGFPAASLAWHSADPASTRSLWRSRSCRGTCRSPSLTPDLAPRGQELPHCKEPKPRRGCESKARESKARGGLPRLSRLQRSTRLPECNGCQNRGAKEERSKARDERQRCLVLRLVWGIGLGRRRAVGIGPGHGQPLTLRFTRALTSICWGPWHPHPSAAGPTSTTSSLDGGYSFQRTFADTSLGRRIPRSTNLAAHRGVSHKRVTGGPTWRDVAPRGPAWLPCRPPRCRCSGFSFSCARRAIASRG